MPAIALLLLAAASPADRLLRIAVPHTAGPPSFRVRAEDLPEGFPEGWRLRLGDRSLPFQYDPADGRITFETGAILPGAHAIAFVGAKATPAPRTALAIREEGGRIRIANGIVEVTHDRAAGGLPAAIRFLRSGKVFDSFRLNDRIHDPGRGGYLLREDPDPGIRWAARGPLRAVLVVEARYLRGGEAPEGGARATYRFEYRAGSPWIRVSARVRQARAIPWRELHLLEINFPDTSFTTFAAGDPLEEGKLAADGRSHRGSRWAALTDGRDVLGIAGSSAIVHDGRGGYGTYIHGPWLAWDGAPRDIEALLYAGPSEEGPRIVARVPREAEGFLSSRALEARWARLRERHRDPLARAGLSLFRAEWRAGMELARVRALLDAWDAAGLDGALRAMGLEATRAGRTGAFFGARDGRLRGLVDLASGRSWLRPAGSGPWRIDLVGPDGERVRGGPGSERLSRLKAKGLAVRCECRGSDEGLILHLAIRGLPDGWSIERVRFPDLALEVPAESRVLYPRVSGCLREGALAGWRFEGDYPSGWCSMQFAAVYDDRSGLYVGIEDPRASTKRIIAAGEEGGLRIAADWPAPDMGRPGNAFRPPGRVRIAAFEGDWYDACRLYRAWVAAEAPWWRARARPSPAWLAEIAIWAQTGGPAKSVVEPVRAFAAYMGVPTALHWYNWHEIPFDVHYPHYFPAKEGFAEGVRALQGAGVRVMPYINGRLWDTALEDFRKGSIAAATKGRDGKPYIEVYGSGAKLAPMCPATPLWQGKVREIVLRLLGPAFGLDAVYIDQVAAARPRLCFDGSHGHPLAGGSWWIDRGYRPLLEALRAKLPPDKVLTTECNAEPYVDLFDGYLTWHFQYADAVPAFAAVYGGRIHLFGRAYRGGPTADLALRMKAAQSLVWGEAIGWIGPDSAKHPVNGPFLRRMARLRHRLRAFLAEGTMLRPPRLEGRVPRVTADWRWSGAWPVTLRAIQVGAWRARDGRVAVVAANVTGEPLEAALRFDPGEYGLAGGRIAASRSTEDGAGMPRVVAPSGRIPFAPGPYEAWAYVLERR